MSDKCESCGVPFDEHDGLIATCRKLKEAEAEVVRLRESIKFHQNHFTPFKNDPFAIVLQAFGELWPNCPMPYIQWTNKGDIYKDKDSPWAHTFIPDDGSEITVELDPVMEVYHAIDVFAHELAHVACHHLGLDQGQDNHGNNWEACYDEIWKVYSRIVNEKQAEVDSKANQDAGG